MNPSQTYILISIVVLVAIALLFFWAGTRRKGGRPGRRLTPLAGIAFAFILAGLLFGSNRLVGYSLLGVGVILAVVDIVRSMRKD